MKNYIKYKNGIRVDMMGNYHGGCKKSCCKNTIITFTNKKQENVSYNHDEVYNAHKSRFEAMNCFAKYKSYTNSNAIPAFCRNLAL